MTAGGYTPDTLIIDPAGAEAIDLFRSSGSEAFYVFGPARFAPSELFGLNVRVSKTAGTAVVDSAAYGKLYVSPITLARFEESAGSDQHEHGSPRGQRRVRRRADLSSRPGDAVMAKKVTLQVIVDAVQHDGNTYANGQQFEVTEAKAKELLKSDKVVKAP